MVFSSVSFLFVYLPMFLAIYALLPCRNLTILVFSLLFYTWGEGLYVLLLLATVLINYFFGKLVADSCNTKLALWVGVSTNLIILLYFKYYEFLVKDVFQIENNLNQLPHLPIGISFFIFQSISYLVDVYRGDAKHARSVFDLALYITMFPQLIAGPIVRYASVADTIKSRVVSKANIYSGTAWFIAGLCQKVLLANNVAEIADKVYSLPTEQVDFVAAWTGTLAYTLQIFFDFSGYSMMAIGIGRIMGFTFPINFNYPYISTSITEFWQRWHISLSSWFRDYLYIPLGGNRKGRIRTYCNLFMVFFLCGLWHGAEWTYIAWGFYHGTLLVFERIGFFGILQRLPQPLRHVYTLLFIIVGWVLFRSETFQQAQWILAAMLGMSEFSIHTVSELVSHENMTYALFGVLFAMPVRPWLSRKISNSLETPAYLIRVMSLLQGLGLSVLFMICTMYIMSGTYNPFIYFRF